MRQVCLVRMASENQRASGYTSGSFGVGSEVAQGVHLSVSSPSTPDLKERQLVLGESQQAEK